MWFNSKNDRLINLAHASSIVVIQDSAQVFHVDAYFQALAVDATGNEHWDVEVLFTGTADECRDFMRQISRELTAKRF